MASVASVFLTLQRPVLRTGAAPRLRRWTAQAAMIAIFYIAVVGTKPLQVRIASSSSIDGDATRQIIYIGAFALLVLGAQPHRNLRRLLVVPWSLAALLVWCAVSLSWAWFPGIAMRRLLLTTVLIWSLLRITDELGFNRSVQLIRALLLAALAANFAAVLLSPVAVHQMGERADGNLIGNWRGFLGHKNWAGALCAMTILFFLYGDNHWRGWIRWAAIAAAIVFLAKSESKTSINMMFVAIPAAFVFRRYSPAYRALLVPLVMVVGSIASLMIVLRWDDLVSPIFGSDREAFTGRVEIWAALLDFARDHPWLGAGFNSFWLVGPDGPMYRYATGWVTELGTGHNGYLDLFVTIGAFGLVLALLAMFVLPLTRLLASTTMPRDSGALVTGIIAFAFGHNLTESTLMERDAIVQLFLVIAIGLLGVSERVARRSVVLSRAADGTAASQSPAPPEAAM